MMCSRPTRGGTVHGWLLKAARGSRLKVGSQSVGRKLPSARFRSVPGAMVTRGSRQPVIAPAPLGPVICFPPSCFFFLLPAFVLPGEIGATRASPLDNRGWVPRQPVRAGRERRRQDRGRPGQDQHGPGEHTGPGERGSARPQQQVAHTRRDPGAVPDHSNKWRTQVVAPGPSRPPRRGPAGGRRGRGRRGRREGGRPRARGQGKGQGRGEKREG